MYKGYFSLGGVEIGNSPRAYGYQHSADCPVLWVAKEQDHPDLFDALGDTRYVYQNITDAPWYDPDNPDRSSRILGLHVMSIDGLDSSSRQVDAQEKVTDGVRLGRTRRSGKQATIQAFLVAKGRDALAAGMTWLESALDADSCGLHGSACGLVDFEYFVDKPSPRGEMQGYTSWATVRRNLFSDPRAIDLARWQAIGNGSLTLRNDFGSYASSTATSAVRWTRALAGEAGVAMRLGTDMPDNEADMRLDVWLRSSVATDVTVYARPDISSPTGQVVLGYTRPIPGGSVEDNFVDGRSFAGNAGPNSGIVIISSAQAGSTYLEVGRVNVEEGVYNPDDVGWFDGNWPPPVEFLQNQWTGTPLASTSYKESREYAMVPESDEVYQARIDPLRRYMHSVKCTAGPTVVEERANADGMHFGKIVQFTISSEVARIFTKSKEIQLGTITPSVMSDVPYNLAPYPSAELTGGGSSIMAINWAPNPSGETDATNWIGGVTTLSGSAPAAYTSFGRIVGELAAAGTASLRNRILGNGSTAASGGARLELSSTVGLGTHLERERYSFTIWAAVLSVGGAQGAAISQLDCIVEWLNGATIVRTDTIGSTTTPADFGGKVFSAKSVNPPTGALTHARVYVRASVNWSSSATPANNSDIRLYADALAVTQP